MLKWTLVFFAFISAALALPPESSLQLKGSAFSYFGNQSLTAPNPNITRAIIVVHGSERNAHTYYNTMNTLTQQLGRAKDTIFLAPHFKLPTDPLIPGELTWTDEGWLRGDSSLSNGRVSSFEVMDNFLALLGDARIFPQLRDVIITGHSAGGQLTQRYAAGSSLAETLSHLNFRFIVANPGSYMYLSENRPMNPGLRCDYNDYKYGTDRFNNYMLRTERSSLVERYIKRELIYFLGENDNFAEGIDQSCPAQYQGRTRLERGRLFKAQLDREFPTHRHRFLTVPNTGHTQWGMYTSDQGRRILFEEL